MSPLNGYKKYPLILPMVQAMSRSMNRLDHKIFGELSTAKRVDTLLTNEIGGKNIR